MLCVVKSKCSRLVGCLHVNVIFKQYKFNYQTSFGLCCGATRSIERQPPHRTAPSFRPSSNVNCTLWIAFLTSALASTLSLCASLRLCLSCRRRYVDSSCLLLIYFNTVAVLYSNSTNRLFVCERAYVCALYTHICTFKHTTIHISVTYTREPIEQRLCNRVTVTNNVRVTVTVNNAAKAFRESSLSYAPSLLSHVFTRSRRRSVQIVTYFC